MKRIDVVNKKLAELTRNQLLMFGEFKEGISTIELSEELNLDRGNVSKELNKLLRQGEVVKISGRPVKYLTKEIMETFYQKEIIGTEFQSINKIKFHINQEGQEMFNSSGDVFKELIGYDGSLEAPIKKAKAAIVYPKNGLMTLITGETGVGKSLFAEKMYEYALQKKSLNVNAPFVVFNCADYADNQQLLLSHLFGYAKGAFTGATEDMNGLVAEAEGGILFLDEVHRLSSKGQEMLFLIMDKGQYQRLGEVNKYRQANIRIIAATTEKPSVTMLSTFIRRIPVHITLPKLSDRTLSEKYQLIKIFFFQEAKRVNEKIEVPTEILNQLLSFNYDSNVGELKSELQFLCANAFLTFVSTNAEHVIIRQQNISTKILEANRLLTVDEKNKIKEFTYHLSDVLEFSANNHEREKNTNANYYNLIKDQWNNYVELGLNEKEIKQNVEDKIKIYTGQLVKKIKSLENETNIATDSLLNSDIQKVVKRKIVNLALGEKESQQVEKVLTYHLNQLVNHDEYIPLNEARLSDKMGIAAEILSEVAQMTGAVFSENEWQIFESIIYQLANPVKSSIGILIIMHGNSTATSMKNTVNSLLDVEHAHSIDMHLTDEVEGVLTKAIKKVKEIDQGGGVLILADMGSILSFPDMITAQTDIKVNVIDMTSTLLAIEATKIAVSENCDLESLYSRLKDLGTTDTSTLVGLNRNQLSYFDQLLIKNMKKILNFLDSEKIFIVLKTVLTEICLSLNTKFMDEFLVKFIFHCSCMVERSFKNEVLKYSDVAHVEKEHSQLLKLIKQSFVHVEEKFDLIIATEELCHIVDMFVSEFGEVEK